MATHKIIAIMKIKPYILLLFIISLVFSSCRTEETQFIQAPEDQRLTATTNTSLLMERTATNDGSINNIVDKANCFDIAFPYVVNANGAQITLNSKADFKTLECVFDASDDDIDSLTIIYPITIIQADFTEISISNITELEFYRNACNGENMSDDDIECIDFQYPIEASTFNVNEELLETLLIENDRQLYNFVTTIDTSDIVTMEFPLMVTLWDNSELMITNFNQLELEIENAIDICDEDDDYDYNDDDCDTCVLAEIENLLISCNDWSVNTLRRDNNTNYDAVYYNYAFNFSDDGTMDVSWNTTTVSGTWVTSGSENNIEIIINIPALPLCNNNWVLQEVKNCSNETEIDLRIGVDRIQYVKNCN
ncbi:MAG: hypothetical protein AB8B52_04750 [Winogradskyella sp.]|uniref:hypothetical protein n=1 Tax=Winogradskyella sp. TaxID=1883156 RepID=UPI0038582688